MRRRCDGDADAEVAALLQYGRQEDGHQGASQEVVGGTRSLVPDHVVNLAESETKQNGGGGKKKSRYKKKPSNHR